MKTFKNIPIFPLKSIILPGGQFPLRIFERRYLDMTRECLKNDKDPFLERFFAQNQRVLIMNFETTAKFSENYGIIYKIFLNNSQ